MDPRSDGCISCYFIDKHFFQLGNSWCEALRRSWRSFPCVGWRLKIGVYGVVCFRSGWSHSALRGRTANFWFISAANREYIWRRIRVRVRIICRTESGIFNNGIADGGCSNWREKQIAQQCKVILNLKDNNLQCPPVELFCLQVVVELLKCRVNSL